MRAVKYKRLARLMLIGLSLIIPLVGQCQERSLLYQAAKVASASEWVYPFYLWKDAHTLLTFRGDKRGESLYSFDLLDLRTGHSQPLTQLTEEWRQYLSTFPDHYSRNPHSRRVDYHSFSPDARWLLLFTHSTVNNLRIVEESEPDGWVLLCVEGGQGRSFQVGRYPIWTRDSRACYWVDDAGYAWTRRMPTGKLRRVSATRCIPRSARFNEGEIQGEEIAISPMPYSGRLTVSISASSTRMPSTLSLPTDTIEYIL